MSDTIDVETIQNLKVPVSFPLLRRAPFWCSVIVSLTSVLVLIGWSFEIDFLKRIVPGYVFMNPTTAVVFILSSYALWLLQSRDARRIRIAQVCAVIILLTGLIKICDLIGFFDIGIDRIFFTNQLFDNVTGKPNRIAPNTALNFVLTGAALLLFNVRKKRSDSFPAQYPAILIILTSFVAIIGYLYGATSFYVIVTSNPMAIHTAVSFLLLAIGLVLSKPDQGFAKEIFSPHIGGQAARRLFPLVVIIPIVLGWLRMFGERMNFFGAEMGTDLLVVVIIIVFSAIVIFNARLTNSAAVKLGQTEEDLNSTSELLQLLGESEKNYRQLADAMPQIVWTARADGFLDYYNQRWFDYTGMTLEETKGWGWEPVLHPDDLQNCIDVWSAAVKTGEKYKVEYRFRQASNGEFRWHLGQALPVRAANGQIFKWFGTCTDIHEQKKVEEELRQIKEDLESRVERRTVALESANIDLREQITERVEAENALRESEEKNREFIENANDVIYTVDLSGKFTSLNRAGEQLTGYTQAEALEMNIADVVSSESAKGLRQKIAGALKGAGIFNDELEVFTKKGGKVIIEVSSRLLQKNGKPTGIQGIGRDITERKKAEIQLKNSEEFNRSIFENSPDGVKVLELDGTLHSMNANGLCVMEIDDFAPFVGKVWSDFWQDEENKAARQAVIDAQNGKSARFEGFCKTAKGTMKYWDVSVAPIFDIEGKPCRLISTSRDITERKRAETEHRVISEIIEGISTTSNLDELLEHTHQSIKKLMYAENFFVALHDKTTDMFEMQFFVDKYDTAPPPFKLSKSQTSYVFRHGHSMRMNEETSVRLEAEGEIELIGTPAAIWLGVPLRTPTEVIGVLVVQHYEDERVYSQRDLKLLTSIGDQIALAIERKRTQESLEASARRENVMIANALDVICSIDAEGKFASVSPASLKVWGYPPEELIGRRYIELVTPEDVAKTNDVAREIVSGNAAMNFENRYVHKNSSLVDVVWTAYWSDAEQLMFCVAHDITERKRIEQQQSAILNALPAHICLLDREGNILEVNNEWKEFAIGNGYSGVNFGIGSNYIETCENATGDCAEGAKKAAEICRAVLAGESSNFEMEYPCHSPTEKRWFKLSVTPLNNEKSTGVVVMHVNITERKQIEEELEQTRDAALESARLKSEFLANMSHEIRTPMNGVIGMTGLLLDTNLSEEQQDYAKTVQGSADALLRIIDDILDFSKIEAGKLHFEKIDFDLRECVESAVETLAERAQSKGIEIASLVYRDVPTPLCGDPGRLRQILTNLIGNAIKFTETGEVTVNVRKQSDAGKYVTLRFEVTDTGIGISEQAQRQLFQAFVQADGSTTRKYGGTGLGLAISKQLVEMMGGEIGVESSFGSGSTFWFTARFEKQAKQISRIQSIAAVTLEGVRVLIVDDNQTNRKIFAHQTASWGMIAAEAESGEIALEKLRAAAEKNEPFEIAILDLMMPEMDGFELARRIKTDSALSKTHLVLLPSYGKRGDGQTAREFGIAAYIQKPVKQSQLYNCLLTVIAESLVESGEDKSKRLITQHSLRTITKAAVESPAISKVRILVAEDNAVNQKVALSQLKSLGYAADVAKNGREAVEAVKKYEYDAVLMDCQMPEMDGFEATAAIRSFEADSSRTTIIAMTAHALEGERERCIAAGMDDYISKPVKLDKLKETLNRWLVRVGESDTKMESLNVAPQSKNHQSIDLSVLNGFKDLQQPNEPDIVTELIDLFLSDAEKRITILKYAIANQETAEIRAQAHGIKGSSGNIGAKRLAILSEKLEEQKIDAAEMQIVFTEIEGEFQSVSRILTGMRLKT